MTDGPHRGTRLGANPASKHHHTGQKQIPDVEWMSKSTSEVRRREISPVDGRDVAGRLLHESRGRKTDGTCTCTCACACTCACHVHVHVHVTCTVAPSFGYAQSERPAFLILVSRIPRSKFTGVNFFVFAPSAPARRARETTVNRPDRHSSFTLSAHHLQSSNAAPLPPACAADSHASTRRTAQARSRSR